MTDEPWARAEGLPFPLGVSWSVHDRAYNFALYSKHATAVHLLLFAGDSSTPRTELALDPRIHRSGRVWHCRVAEATVDACRYYGYRVDGPATTGPFEVHAFAPDKVLVDPYARTIAFPPAFGSAPIGVIAAGDPAFAWGHDHHPRHEAKALIYELHVRAFTMHPSSGVPASARGTFAGVVAKIPYLRELGVTVVELMPVFQFDPHGRDVWGYMPMSFFAPHAGYAPDGVAPIDAFRAMVKALHEADIEVVIDAVYNHTAEAGADGPTYGLKGIDNSTYYLMAGGTYANYSGCGNSVNANNRYVRKMILDSMRHWSRDLHVDGFRFDLASIFARGAGGALDLDDPPIFGDVASVPGFDRLRMIAEPWDAAGAYELGRAFPGVSWMQWNDRFRDDVRRFVRGDPGMTGALMQRMYGSDDLFPDDVMHAYHAYQSINYISSHDGFTLYDLLAYERKRNPDGAAETTSTGCGWDGDDGVPPEVMGRRERRAKNLIALLLLANGTPMLRAGDELLATQGGHNNPYDQDNATTWLDWDRRARFAGFWRFVQQMIAFRAAHPTLARSRFWRDDVHWFGPGGVVDFAQPVVAWHLVGASQGDRDLYVMVNGGDAPATFVVQATERAWCLAVDTARASPDDIDAGARAPIGRPSCTVDAHAVVVLVGE